MPMEPAHRIYLMNEKCHISCNSQANIWGMRLSFAGTVQAVLKHSSLEINLLIKRADSRNLNRNCEILIFIIFRNPKNLKMHKENYPIDLFMLL
jgi:hypothetical protein